MPRVKLKTEKTTKGMKFDGEKPRWSLLPWGALNQVAWVLTAGSKKYEDHNWQKVDKFYDRYFSAIGRHLRDYAEGKEFDEDIYERYGIKVSHMACVACNALFILWKELKDGKDLTQ